MTAISVQQLAKRYRLGETAGLPTVLCRSLRESNIGRWWSSVSASSARTTDIWALRDVSFDVHAGEAVGLIGRNGAGKSTLLKILARITQPTRGRVALRGQVASLLEVGTGFHPELTGRENVYLNGAILGMRRGDIARRFDAIVTFSGVEQFIDTPVKRYSSGMTVRLAFAVAAHLEPEILLIDEVLAVGDAAFQKRCLNRMDEAAREGRTILFVSHNLVAVRNLCTRAICIADGQVVKDSDPSTAIAFYLGGLEDTSTRLAHRQRPSASNGVHIDAIEVRPSSGGDIICSQDALDISIGYEADEPLRNVNFALGIYDTSGAEIYFLDTETAGGIPPVLGRRGTVRCVTGPLNMTAGTCYINAALINGSPHAGTVLDYVERAVSFEVQASDFYGTGKMPPRNFALCLLGQHWEWVAE